MSLGVHPRLPLRAVLVLALALAGCARRAPPGAPEGDPATRAAPAAPAAPPPAATVPATRALLDEVGRAELWAGGPFVDLGTPDQHKYTLGGYETGWGPLRVGPDGVTYAAAVGAAPRLVIPVADAAITALELRGRSAVRGQVVRLQVNGRPLGAAALGAAWTTVRVAVPPGALVAGPNTLELGFGAAAPVAAEVDWVWLRAAGGPAAAPSGPRVLPLRLGGAVRRALCAPGPRRYSFHLDVDGPARLVFSYGAEHPTRFAVRAATDDGAVRELWQATTSAPGWRPAEVDLGAAAGRPLRLELEADGPVGVAGWGEPEVRHQVAAAAGDAPAGPAPRNLVLVVVDTLRADAVTPGAPLAAHAPAVARLAAEGTSFTQAHTSANCTRPSMITILSGLAPETHGTHGLLSVIPPQVELLSTHLRRNGFATAAFHANPICGSRFGFNRDWDLFHNYHDNEEQWTPASVKTPAATLFQDALAWVRQQRRQRPFFLVVHTIEPHAPYRPAERLARPYGPAGYSGPFARGLEMNQQGRLLYGTIAPSPADVAAIRGRYRGEVAGHDEALDRFLQALGQDGRLDDTLVVVTSDHGESLGEHGSWGHHLSLHEEEARVPLVMRHPGTLRRGRRVEAPVELTDLAPTLVAALAAPPLPAADGASLLPLLRGQTAVAEHPVLVSHEKRRHAPPQPGQPFLAGGSGRALRAGRFKLIVDRDGRRTRLFDLTADPGEENDLALARPVTRRYCEILLAEAIATPRKSLRRAGTGVALTLPPAAVGRLDPALKRQLEALGYLAP
ncbi:MAG TPA: sulfatase [Polyangia bacterium]